MVSKEELKLISDYCERPEKPKGNVMYDIDRIRSFGIPVGLECSEEGDMRWSCSTDDLSRSDITAEAFYRFCENGWRVDGEEFTKKNE